MTKEHANSPKNSTGYRYRSPNIPMSAIRRFARQIAEKFRPDKIILFGSYAGGHPHEESDVDLLVVMPARNEIDQAVRIVLALESPFSLDLIVRTPKRLDRDLREGDWFLQEIVAKGKVLYEATNRTMGPKGRGRLSGRDKPGRGWSSALGLRVPEACPIPTETT